MLLTLPETTDKQAYLKNKVLVAGEDAYFHGMAHFNRILRTFHPDSVNTAHASARCSTLNRRYEPSFVKPPGKRKDN